jgi:hypothetical protein
MAGVATAGVESVQGCPCDVSGLGAVERREVTLSESAIELLVRIGAIEERR